MKQKGKYKLLSFLIEDCLLFYTSLNKNKKIIAFALFKNADYDVLIPVLNKLLDNNILNYYSIQFDVAGESKPLFILNFKDNKKKTIIKLFQLTHQKLNKIKVLHFLKEKELEHDFLNIFIDNINPNLKISKYDHSILLKNNRKTRILELYSIDLRNLKNHISFIINFLKFSRDYKKTGYLIFNLKKGKENQIIIASYFIHVGENDENFNKIELNFNKLYHYDLIRKQNLDLHNLYCILWRTDVSSTTIPYLNILKVFKIKDEKKFSNISSFNSYFEELLIKHQFEYKRLNKNLFFIEYSNLFFVFPKFESKLILGILKKYEKKYFIYILILNEQDNAKVLEIQQSNTRDNIRILGMNEIESFDIKVLKNKN